MIYFNVNLFASYRILMSCFLCPCKSLIVGTYCELEVVSQSNTERFYNHEKMFKKHLTLQIQAIFNKKFSAILSNYMSFWCGFTWKLSYKNFLVLVDYHLGISNIWGARVSMQAFSKHQTY